MRKITKFLMAGLMLLTCAVGLSNTRGEVKEAEAATTDKWSLVGSINSWNPADQTYTFKYDSSDKRFELEIQLSKGDTFKIVKDYGWNYEIGYAGNSNHNAYLEANGDWYDYGESNVKYADFKVKESNKYLLTLVDGVAGYGNRAYGFGIEKIDPKKFTVNYYDGDTSCADADVYTEGQTFNSKFVEKEGYRFEGWFTDKALTSEFKKGSVIDDNLTLYAKYVEATDYTISFEYAASTGWEKVYAYAWRDSSDGTYNAAWPGVEMTSLNGIFTYKVDASQSYSKIIFNNNSGKQTMNLDLETSDGIYTLGDKKSEGYTATFTSTDFMVGKIDIEDESLGIAYKFFSALPVEANKNANEEYNVGFKFEFIKPDTEEVSATGYYTCSNLKTLTYVADGDEVAEEHTAITDGYKTYFAVTVYEIPADYKGGKVIVTPAYQNTNGHTVMCVAETFTI